MFGGCGNGTVCSNNSLDLECHNDDESKGNGLFGTCTPEFDDFSTVTFGNGTFRKGSYTISFSLYFIPILLIIIPNLFH